MEPIRVYAGKSTSRTLEQTVDAVLAELDRTDAWDRDVLALFTGTGTGWLQEWSISAIEFLTGGNCATASLQYSVYTSGLSYMLDRRTPQEAGRLLFTAVRRRLDKIPPRISVPPASSSPENPSDPSEARRHSATSPPRCSARSTAPSGPAPPPRSRRCGSS